MTDAECFSTLIAIARDHRLGATDVRLAAAVLLRLDGKVQHVQLAALLRRSEVSVRRTIVRLIRAGLLHPRPEGDLPFPRVPSGTDRASTTTRLSWLATLFDRAGPAGLRVGILILAAADLDTGFAVVCPANLCAQLGRSSSAISYAIDRLIAANAIRLVARGYGSRPATFRLLELMPAAVEKPSPRSRIVRHAVPLHAVGIVEGTAI